MQQIWSILVFLVWMIIVFSVHAENYLTLQGQELQELVKSYDRIHTETWYFEKYTQNFETYDCPKNIYRIQSFINKVDQLIYNSQNTSKVRWVVYKVLISKQKKWSTLLGDQTRTYLMKYYDDDPTNDFFTWCFGSPDASSFWPNIAEWRYFWPGIRWGHLILKGYPLREKMVVSNPACMAITDGDCQNYSVELLFFVLSEDMNANLLWREWWGSDASQPLKKWEKIQLWCLLPDNALLVSQYSIFPYLHVNKTESFVLPSTAISWIFNATKEKPITISAGYQISVTNYWNLHYGPVCWWEFRTIDIVK